MIRTAINAREAKGVISRNIYGHFSEHLGRCIYGGIWVGKDSPIPNINGIRADIVKALKELHIPVLRWPGGCFADEYHWMDGIGPAEKRPRMINTHWGGVIENNHFGTHEFFELCELIGAEPYICGNLGSGTIREMQQWIEYITFNGKSPMADLRRSNGRDKAWKLKYFGIGNESWGCGGNMRPEYYSDLYRRYSTYVRNFCGNKIFRIACGPNADDYTWTEVLMSQAGRFMDGLSLHYYTIPSGNWDKKGSAVDFNADEWYATLKNTCFMEELIIKHGRIMDKYDPDKRIALIVDEWGTWYDVEPGTNPGFLYQQNTIRDALVAGINLNIYNNHCDRVKMANLAQAVNVLQAVILTRDDKMILTPTYHVFDMYKVHHDAELLDMDLDNAEYEFNGTRLPMLSASASRDTLGRIHISICNLSHEKSCDIDFEIQGSDVSMATGTILTASEINARNTFDEPDAVKPVPFENVKITDSHVSCSIPSKSVVVLELC